MRKPVHHVAREPMMLAQCLARNFRLAPARIAELLDLGAVWLEGRRVGENVPLRPGAHLQLYLQPVRFPADEIDWTRVVAYEERDFLVVDKPAGVPVHATPDNRRDNVLFHLRETLRRELYVTQRLDTPVTGLFVIAKTPEFQRAFNEKLAAHAVTKHYRALVEGEPAKGRHVHVLDGQRCELTVLATEPRLFPISPRPYFDTTIELHTGRTHQIRAQLALLGCPVLGDKRYRSRARYSRLKLGRGIALTATRIAWDRYSFERSPAWQRPSP